MSNFFFRCFSGFPSRPLRSQSFSTLVEWRTNSSKKSAHTHNKYFVELTATFTIIPNPASDGHGKQPTDDDDDGWWLNVIVCVPRACTPLLMTMFVIWFSEITFTRTPHTIRSSKAHCAIVLQNVNFHCKNNGAFAEYANRTKMLSRCLHWQQQWFFSLLVRFYFSSLNWNELLPATAAGCALNAYALNRILFLLPSFVRRELKIIIKMKM